MEQTTKQQTKSPGDTLKRFWPLAAILLVFILAYWQGWFQYLSIEQLAINFEDLSKLISANFVVAIAAYMGIYIIAVALSFPGASILTFAGGLFFGWHIGGAATVIAATIGAILIFLIAKTALGETLAERAGPFVNKLRDGFQENAMSYMLFLRLVPLFPFWLINIAPAILGVRLSTFTIGTAVGIIPGTFAFTFIGSGLEKTITDNLGPYQACLESGKNDCVFEFSLSTLISNELKIGLVLLAVVALIPVVVKKLRKTD